MASRPPSSYLPTLTAQIAGPVIAAELGQVGIDVTVTQGGSDAATENVIKSGAFGLAVVDQSAGRDLGSYADPASPWHYAYSDQVAALLDAGNEASTEQEWINDYQQALRLITSDAVNDWLYVQPQITIADKNVGGLSPAGLSDAFPLAGLTVS